MFLASIYHTNNTNNPNNTHNADISLPPTTYPNLPHTTYTPRCVSPA